MKSGGQGCNGLHCSVARNRNERATTINTASQASQAVSVGLLAAAPGSGSSIVGSKSNKHRPGRRLSGRDSGWWTVNG
jgi:hypothetical protein